MSDPTNTTELLAARTTALGAYSDALDTLRSTHVELRAIDLALANRNVAAQLPSFPSEICEGVPQILQHPSARGPSGRWADLVNSRARQLLSGMGFNV